MKTKRKSCERRIRGRRCENREEEEVRSTPEVKEAAAAARTRWGDEEGEEDEKERQGKAGFGKGRKKCFYVRV